MADSTTNKEAIKTTIDELKTHLASSGETKSSIKVLENMGDYLYVLKFLAFNEYDINVTLQILDLTSINLITSSAKLQSANAEKFSALQAEFQTFLTTSSTVHQNPLIVFYNRALEYVIANFAKPAVHVNGKSPKSKEKEKLSVKKQAAKTGEDEEEKSTSMKTSEDVLHRIMWDTAINKDYITVGYLDRFVGIKECAFSVFDWGDIVLADLNALAIPKHRINYFKYKNEVVWDKNNRLDNVFGSTGSGVTIHDVIARLEAVNFVGKLEGVDQEDAVDDETHRLGRAKAPSQLKPNFFIAIPITDATIKANLASLCKQLVSANGSVMESLLLPDTSLHLTLCTLRIEDEVEMSAVKRHMHAIQQDAACLAKYFPIQLQFTGIGEFFNKVLHIKCASPQMDKLASLRTDLIERIAALNINMAGNYYDFVPHLTVFKVAKSNQEALSKEQNTVSALVNADTWRAYDKFVFGEQTVNEIELCKMVNIFTCKTYPVEFTMKTS